MAGFLDASERIIDLVLTDTGKSLLLQGGLRFAYWIPFDDEVDYQPDVTIWNSGTLTADELSAAVTEKRRNMIEDPVIREATMGYRGMNNTQEDTTNLVYPMYSASPGVGRTSPLPQMTTSTTGALDVIINQSYMIKRKFKNNKGGEAINSLMSETGFQRTVTSDACVDVGFTTGSFTLDNSLEGFLVTMFQHVSGTLQEVIHNRNSDGDIVYRNDLMLKLTK